MSDDNLMFVSDAEMSLRKKTGTLQHRDKQMAAGDGFDGIGQIAELGPKLELDAVIMRRIPGLKKNALDLELNIAGSGHKNLAQKSVGVIDHAAKLIGNRHV